MPENILFVCVGDDNRIIESFFHQSILKEFNILNIDPLHSLWFNLTTINMIKQIGIVATEQILKKLSDYMKDNLSKIVNMRWTEKESYQILFVNVVIDWNTSFLKEKYVKVKPIQNKTKSKILNYVKSVEVSAI